MVSPNLILRVAEHNVGVRRGVCTTPNHLSTTFTLVWFVRCTMAVRALSIPHSCTHCRIATSGPNAPSLGPSTCGGAVRGGREGPARTGTGRSKLRKPRAIHMWWCRERSRRGCAIAVTPHGQRAQFRVSHDSTPPTQFPRLSSVGWSVTCLVVLF